MEKESSDTQTVLEMLLFPDQDTRIALEALLDPAGLKPHHVSNITDFLVYNHTKLNLHHPEEDTSIVIEVPTGQIELFISRLFLTRTIDPEICQTLEEECPVSIALLCRVFFRCKNVVFEKNKRQYLIGFIKKAHKRDHKFIDLFEMFLTLLSEAPDSGEYESYFLERRAQEKNLQKRIQKFEEKHDRYCMEYLMMSKYQVPPDSIENVENRLRKLDIIINDILCIPPLQNFSPPVRDLGRLDPKTDMETIFNLLSQ